METEEQARERLGLYYIPIWKGCDPTISQAIKDFRERWKPYSTSSRRYPIGRLIQEMIDPAVAAYMAALPARYSGHVPGAGAGVGFSEIIRLVGFDAMTRMQRQLLRQFIRDCHQAAGQWTTTIDTPSSVQGIGLDSRDLRLEKASQALLFLTPVASTKMTNY